MDIVNWLYLKTRNFIKPTINNTDTDLVMLGAYVGPLIRDDQYETYAMGVQDFADGLYPLTVKHLLYTFGADSVSPGDNIEYFIGNSYNLAPASTTGNDGRRVLMNFNGTISSVKLGVTITGTLGTAEPVTVRLNNASTGQVVTASTTITMDQQNALFPLSFPTPLVVNVNDKVSLSFVTPAFATNPTTVRMQGNLILEYYQ